MAATGPDGALADEEARKPTTGSATGGCCARVTCGQVADIPPVTVMNCRRFMSGLMVTAHKAPAKGLFDLWSFLRVVRPMSALGQTRNFLTALALSAFPPVADECPFLRQLEGPNSLDA